MTHARPRDTFQAAAPPHCGRPQFARLFHFPPHPCYPQQDMSKSTTRHVNVLVFKDQSVARSFELPLGWLTRLSVGVALLFAACIALSVFALYEYRLARKFDPSRIVDLEQELREARETRSRPIPAVAPQPAAPPTASATPAAALPLAPPAAPLPAATVTTPAQTSAELFFRALPASVTAPDANSPAPIKIQTPQATWSGTAIRLKFSLQFVGPEGGNYQGRIAVIARGANTVLGYPDTLFGNGTDAELIHPDKGESFSVSRFREAKINFVPVKTRASIQQIDILIFSNDGKLIAHQVVTPQAPATPKPATLAPATTTPAVIAPPGIPQ